MPTFTTKDYKAALRSRGARTTSAGGFSIKNDNSFIVIFSVTMMAFIFFYGVLTGLDLDKLFFAESRGGGRYSNGLLGLIIAGIAWYKGSDGDGLYKFNDYAITFVSGAHNREILLSNIDYIKLTPGFLRTCTSYTALKHSRYVKNEQLFKFGIGSMIVLWLVGIAMSEQLTMAYEMLAAGCLNLTTTRLPSFQTSARAKFCSLISTTLGSLQAFCAPAPATRRLATPAT